MFAVTLLLSGVPLAETQQPPATPTVRVMELRFDREVKENVAVRVLLPGGTARTDHDLRLQEEIVTGTYVEIPSKTQVILKSLQGRRIELHPDSCYELVAVEPSERHRVRCGLVRFEVARRWVKGQFNFFNVDGQGVVLAVHGTKFSVEVKPREFVRIRREEGEIAIVEYAVGAPTEPTATEPIVLNETGRQEYFKRFPPDDYLKSHDSYQDAETLYRGRVTAARQSGDPKRLSQALLDLGLIFQVLGRPHDAIAPFEQALALAEREGDTRRQVWLLTDLGNAYQEQHDTKRALSFHEKALQLQYDRHPTGKHRDIADSLNNLGNVYYRQQDFRRAIELHQAARAMREGLLFRGRSEAIAQSENNLGESYRSAGEPRAALEHLQKALSRRLDLYPDQRHPDLADTYNNLGNAYLALGDPAKALANYQQALAIRRQLFPQGRHPKIAQSLSNVGSALVAQGEIDRALMFFAEALRIAENNYPDGVHPDLIEIYEQFAEATAQQGDRATEAYFRARAHEVETAIKTRER